MSKQPQVISQTPNGIGREIRVAISEFKGRLLLDIRKWLEIDGKWKATQKGLSVQTVNALLVGDGVQRATAELAELESGVRR